MMVLMAVTQIWDRKCCLTIWDNGQGQSGKAHYDRYIGVDKQSAPHGACWRYSKELISILAATYCDGGTRSRQLAWSRAIPTIDVCSIASGAFFSSTPVYGGLLSTTLSLYNNENDHQERRRRCCYEPLASK